MYFDRFDICTAYYVYAMQYHEGQYSRIYKIFGRLANINFRISPLIKNEMDLSENARDIYNNLVLKRHLQTI